MEILYEAPKVDILRELRVLGSLMVEMKQHMRECEGCATRSWCETGTLLKKYQKTAVDELNREQDKVVRFELL